MKRFLIFPLTLGIAAALWLPLSIIAAVLGTWLPLSNTNSEKIGFAVIPVIEVTSLPLFAIGFVIGLLTVGGDWLLKRRAHDFAPRFREHLAWFFCYSTLIILSNEAVVHLVLLRAKQSGGGPLYNVEEFATLLPIVLNLMAILFAVAQTLSQSPVLTPRVLLAKLRRSSSLS